MISKIYSVKDKLAEFSGPIAVRDEKIALRWFESFCKEKKNAEYTDCKYFDLYEIGTFDSESGEITGYPKQEIKLIKEGEQFESET